LVPPYVIRLRLDRLDTSGRTVGRLYALSTAGSIVGTFLGGFVLLSWFSTTQILFGVAGGMILLSLAAWPRGVAVAAVLGLFWGGAAWMANARGDLWPGAWPGTKIVESPYNTLMVTEGVLGGSQRLMRFLSTDPGSCQSAIYIDAPDVLALSYTHFYGLGPALKPDARRVLMLGGGGYAVPRWLLAGKSGLAPGSLKLDVVEIDPGMTATAKAYFGIPDDPRLSVIHQDARVFLNHNRAQYDLVFVDVFGSWYSVPFQMGTVEAMAELRRAVAPGGMVIMNIISSLEGDKGKLYASISNAIRSAFPETHTFAVRDPSRRGDVQNIMVLAFAKPRPDLAGLLRSRPPDAPGAARTLTHMLARRVEVKTRDVPALTDAYAPVERYVRPLL
jgi:spermidine synthase